MLWWCVRLTNIDICFKHFSVESHVHGQRKGEKEIKREKRRTSVHKYFIWNNNRHFCLLFLTTITFVRCLWTEQTLCYLWLNHIHFCIAMPSVSWSIICRIFLSFTNKIILTTAKCVAIKKIFKLFKHLVQIARQTMEWFQMFFLSLRSKFVRMQSESSESHWRNILFYFVSAMYTKTKNQMNGSEWDVQIFACANFISK